MLKFGPIVEFGVPTNKEKMEKLRLSKTKG